MQHTYDYFFISLYLLLGKLLIYADIFIVHIEPSKRNVKSLLLNADGAFPGISAAPH